MHKNLVPAGNKKAYIFGAGMAGQRAFKNLQNDYHILGFIDNDKDKQGTALFGLPIIAPHKMTVTEAETIFIASEFFEQIQHQLCTELDIVPSRISPLPARMLTAKRFEHDPVSIAMSLKLLNTCCEALQELDASHHIDAGTLLGVYRDNSLIPWDDDMDIAIDANAVERVAECLNVFVQRLVNISGQPWQATICYTEQAFGNVPAGAIRAFKFSCEVEDSLPSIDFFVKYRCSEFSDYCLASRAIRMPAKFTTNILTFSCQGYEWPIPGDTEGYLTYHYGNWRVPDPDWCLQDLNNTEVFKQ
ncbi:nucleoside-diphosphate sugar epimerase/dehydratase [Alteromonas flava]|uniref:nucleoside-diphosphate sugar epimerase/dehydratase n=1 Tax=Alteromonas flava TaxID=2048003 RepID=UPI000C283A86|nr:LicD family protein [Alteromonas flava]